MKEYVKMLNKYLSVNPPELTKCQMEKILDMLYCCYAQRKGNDSEQVGRAFREMDSILEQLSIQEQDAVVDVACGLCIEHQREGFRDGILVGFRLFTELSRP